MSKLELDQLRANLRAIASEGSKRGGYTSRHISRLARERHAASVSKLDTEIIDLGLMSLLRGTRTGRAQVLDEAGQDLFVEIRAPKSFMVFADRPNGKHEKVQKNTEDLTVEEVDQLILSADSAPARERKDLKALKEIRARIATDVPKETTVRVALTKK